MGYRSYSYNEYLRAMKMIKILGVVETSRRTGIPKPTVEGWKHGKVPPLARWVPESSKELAYVLGVLHGDGSVYIDKYGRYRIRLGVKDLKFAEAFSRAMARLFGKNVKKPHWNKSNNVWVVVYYSKAFYVWYKQQNLDTLKPYIEYSRETVANFLRGLYDSDGGHYIYKRRYSHIHLSNNDKDLLRYVQHLLEKYFGINATGPYINDRAGKISTRGDGEKIKTNYNNYSIAISRKLHIQKFLNEIRFSIEEKQLGLKRRK